MEQTIISSIIGAIIGGLLGRRQNQKEKELKTAEVYPNTIAIKKFTAYSRLAEIVPIGPERDRFLKMAENEIKQMGSAVLVYKKNIE